jgi:uncharacterized protein (DUF302 family)
MFISVRFGLDLPAHVVVHDDHDGRVAHVLRRDRASFGDHW